MRVDSRAMSDKAINCVELRIIAGLRLGPQWNLLRADDSPILGDALKSTWDVDGGRHDCV